MEGSERTGKVCAARRAYWSLRYIIPGPVLKTLLGHELTKRPLPEVRQQILPFPSTKPADRQSARIAPNWPSADNGKRKVEPNMARKR